MTLYDNEISLFGASLCRPNELEKKRKHNSGKRKRERKNGWKIYSSLTRKTQKVKSEISLSFARVIHLEFKLFWNMFIS